MTATSTATAPVLYDANFLTDYDVHLFNEGTYYRLYEKFGSHPIVHQGVEGTHFAVWAPNARYVTVQGDFNGWDKWSHHLSPRGGSGIWQGFIPGAQKGNRYKYFVESNHNNYKIDKSDPLAFANEQPPRQASIIADLDYQWRDQEWMENRKSRNSLSAPMSIYEMHLGSWKRVPSEGHRPLSYRETAPQLAEYCKWMGFTHVELMPIMEHPLTASWGYQVTGYFAATSRYGSPQDLMYLIDVLHQNGIGVILDWVPAHFPNDGHGLSYFDGTHLYEHADTRKGYHPDWKSCIFNYGRSEVRSFLMGSAVFWLDKYHIDGLRVDAVASMIYLNYSRKDGEWLPNQYGGHENLEAISLVRRTNEIVYENYPDVQMIAEESTSWAMVSRPVYVGGLGFGLKWDMGWMHDSLRYLSKDPLYRKYHHNDLTFRMLYAFNENFVLPLSHDEVVHGKSSLLHKMPGDDWQKFANLRLLFGYQYSQAAKKLIFMGGEFGQRAEWNFDASLDWGLVEHAPHRGVMLWVRDLNWLYRSDPALHELDVQPGGFEWVEPNDSDQSVVSFLRRGKSVKHWILAIGNFTPTPRYDYRVGVPMGGFWREVLNSDAGIYGGSGMGNQGGVWADDQGSHGRPKSVRVTLPPLALVFLRSEEPAE